MIYIGEIIDGINYRYKFFISNKGVDINKKYHVIDMEKQLTREIFNKQQTYEPWYAVALNRWKRLKYEKI